MKDASKTPVEYRKLIFWQTSVNDQRPKLRVYISDVVIEGLRDMGVDVNIITLES